ncbi:MAG TPA: monofunctional biosynthetic peptidoglycan transglycosylase [Burkholderiaceae bacterium]|nr:monofunctional biosynthetic peptidoglycan transglycosylase [Burkholderiaceae bacterium]
MRAVLRWLLRGLLLALIVLLSIQLWYFGWVAWWKWNDPGETSFMSRELTALREKKPNAELKHRWIEYPRISNHLKRAVIASEDANFTEHEGVDWQAIEKAYKENVRKGKVARGGSTITQQLAKNLFLSSERSYWRKGQELAITYMIEAMWDKRRILEVYLNVVEWGDGVFGAEAAARQYFNVSASQLSAEQSARLAAYLPNPKRYGRIRSGPYLDRRTAAIQRFMPDASVP